MGKQEGLAFGLENLFVGPVCGSISIEASTSISICVKAYLAKIIGGIDCLRSAVWV